MAVFIEEGNMIKESLVKVIRGENLSEDEMEKRQDIILRVLTALRLEEDAADS